MGFCIPWRWICFKAFTIRDSEIAIEWDAFSQAQKDYDRLIAPLLSQLKRGEFEGVLGSENEGYQVIGRFLDIFLILGIRLSHNRHLRGGSYIFCL